MWYCPVMSDSQSIIRRARRNLGLTQEELADACNVSVRTIRRLESDPEHVTQPKVAFKIEQGIRELYRQREEAHRG